MVDVTRGNHGTGCGLAEASRVVKSARTASDNSTLLLSRMVPVASSNWIKALA
jgi:hypothetical protein